jgi:hypothetical protein
VTVRDKAFAVANGMDDWTVRSLEPRKYYVDGKWVDSTDVRCLVWVLPEVSGCTYDHGEDSYCVLTVYDNTKTRPPFKPSRKHPVPNRFQVCDPDRRFTLQVHDADDGYWERFYPGNPIKEVLFLLGAQPLGLGDLRLVFGY